MAAMTAAALPALAGGSASYTVRPGWGEWWLPINYSKHGGAVDGLFTVIFWLTMIVMIVVEVTLLVFLIKYRRDPNKTKGKFIHGNTRLEMVWTLIPAVILAVLALASKHIWDRYRYAEEYDNTAQTEVMVIGEQFQWNFVYPGKDGKFGEYLAFPKPADAKYRMMKSEEAQKKIVADIIENPLGQNMNWDEPDAVNGQDDNYDHNPGRPLILPVERPIAVRLSSKDVIHDFFLPNFRVKLDALPGMSGRINFTSRADGQSTEDVNINDPRLLAKANEGVGKGYKIWIDGRTPGAIKLPNDQVSQVNYALNGRGADGNVLQVKSHEDLSAERLAALKAAGVTKVTIVSRPFELVCEELCGANHFSMRGEVWMVSPQQYDAFVQQPETTDSTAPKQPTVGSATTQPSPVAARR